MAKIQIKSEKLTPFGGIFSIMEKFDSMYGAQNEAYRREDERKVGKGV